jgi:hypothetical protein
MVHPERGHHEQWGRVERLLQLVLAKDQVEAHPGLRHYDLVVLCIQAMWNLKDWILNDPDFGAKSLLELKTEIFNTPILLVCSDLANGTKHFQLDNPKTGIGISGRMGLHADPAKGIYQELIYIIAPDRNGPFHGKEVRDFLQECRNAWQRIIDKHYLSSVDMVDK